MQRLCSFAAAVLAVAVARPAIAGSGCFAHRPNYIEGKIEVTYEAGCTGHDEPELAPISSAPGSARDLTWTVVLPSDGAVPVDAVGPTFWFGGTVIGDRVYRKPMHLYVCLGTSLALFPLCCCCQRCRSGLREQEETIRTRWKRDEAMGLVESKPVVVLRVDHDRVRGDGLRCRQYAPYRVSNEQVPDPGAFRPLMSCEPADESGGDCLVPR